MQETSRADLEAAWKDREEEASTLIAKGSFSMALALRIYALEIRLKCSICRHLHLEYLPKVCKTHDLADLVIFTGRWKELEESANAQVASRWELLADFSKKRLNDVRYQPETALDRGEIISLIEALDNPDYGVLAWLSGHP